ncbi:hypothetical protein AC1031_020193 [Aphanomyces cochlioides]|nr:hypothetical protein AC1031_020193 [Aphanomyces cochlioides]
MVKKRHGIDETDKAAKRPKNDAASAPAQPQSQPQAQAPPVASNAVLRNLLLNVQKGQLDPVVITLREFLTAVSPETTSCSLLRAYLEISPQSEPLIDLWGSTLWTEDKSRQIIPITMELLQRVMEYLSHHTPSVAETVAMNLLKTKMEHIAKQLSWSDKPYIVYSTLALCTTMLCIHARVAREFVRLFDFTAKSFEALCVRRSRDFDVPETTRQINVRHAFITFALALTTSSDPHVRRFAVKADGIATGLFKCIEDDTFDNASLILSTLTSSILTSDGIRTKHNVFSTTTISHLIKLLDSSDEKSVQLAQDFFDTLFFTPTSLYYLSQEATITEPSASNESHDAAFKVVSKIVSSFDLMSTMTHTAREALLFRFLRAFPALILVVFQSFHAVMDPRPSYKWFSAASFVLKALHVPLTPLKDIRWTSQHHDLLVKLVLPLGLQKKELSKAVQHTNLLVVHTSLNLVSVVLRRFAFLKLCVDDNNGDAVSLEKDVRTLLPPPELILTLCTKLRPAAGGEDSKQAMIYAKALSVLQLYFEHLPAVMSEVKFDISKLIGVETNVLLQGSLLGLLEHVDSSRLGWIVSGDATKFRILLGYCTSSQSVIAVLGHRVVRRVLACLHIFGLTKPDAQAPHEIDAWLLHLKSGEAVTFFDQLVRGVTANPFAFVNDSSMSPMTRALVAYFESTATSDNNSFPFSISVNEPTVVHAFGVRVLSSLLSILPSLKLSDTSKLPKKSIVADFLKTTSSLISKKQVTSTSKPTKVSVTDCVKHIVRLEAADFTLSSELLTAIYKTSQSFDPLYVYFDTYKTKSIFESKAIRQAIEHPDKAEPIMRQFVQMPPLHVVLTSLFSPFVWLSHSSGPSIQPKHLIAYLSKIKLNIQSVQLTCLSLTFGLRIYQTRRQKGFVPDAKYTEAMVHSVKALHFLLTWALGKSSDAFWSMIWQHHAELLANLYENDDVLAQWLVLPYALSSFLPKSSLDVLQIKSNSPLQVVMARHASSSQVHGALYSMLTTKFVCSPLVVHLLSYCIEEPIDDPELFNAVFRFWKHHPREGNAKRWLASAIQKYSVASPTIAQELFQLIWETNSTDPLNILVLQQLIRRSSICREDFASGQRKAQSLSSVMQLCAAYLTSLPLEPTCVSWIETMIVPSCIEEIISTEEASDSMATLVQVVDCLYSQEGKVLPCSEWVPELLQQKRGVHAAKLQLLLLAAHRSDLSRFASKCVGFILSILNHHDGFSSDSSTLDALSFVLLDVLQRYNPKKVPTSAVESLVKHLDSHSDWTHRSSMLDAVSTLADTFSSVDFSSLLQQLLDNFDTLVDVGSFLKALGVLLEKETRVDIDVDFQKQVLAQYGATLSAKDLHLKAILEVLETRGLSLDQVGYCFGKANQTATTDMAQHWLLEEIDNHTMRRSIEQFPHTRPFTGTFPPEENVVYDPAFFIPLIAHAVSSSHIPDRQLLQSGILGYAICGLSAEDEKIRAYAYGIVAVAHEAMSATARTFEFNERRQVHLLLETLKNGISQPHERVPFLITLFANDAISALMKPGHFMYPLVNAFLLSRSALDVNDVPMFYALFNSSASTFRAERTWLLHLVKRGVKLDGDVELLQRRHVYSILLGFFDSPLADTQSQELVLDILSSSIATASGMFLLVHKMGLLAWLEFVAIKYKTQYLRQILAMSITALQNYHLPEKQNDRYLPNTLTQLRQLGQTLVSITTDEHTDLLRLLLLEYFQFCSTKPQVAISMWFSLDLLETTVKLVAPLEDNKTLLSHTVSFLARIATASRDLQFNKATYDRWAAIAAWAVEQVPLTNYLELKLALPQTIQHLTKEVPAFRECLKLT